MKKILYSEMNAVGNVMDSVLQAPALRNGMKKATLFKFWGKVVGKKFENLSTIATLSTAGQKTVLTVACSSAAVTSELSMYKETLLKKINTYANPLAIQIDDINFSHKIWQNEDLRTKETFENKVNIQEENPYTENLEGFNPDEITLSEEEVSEIRDNVFNNSALTQQQKERLFESIINDLKVQKFLNK